MHFSIQCLGNVIHTRSQRLVVVTSISKKIQLNIRSISINSNDTDGGPGREEEAVALDQSASCSCISGFLILDVGTENWERITHQWYVHLIHLASWSMKRWIVGYHWYLLAILWGSETFDGSRLVDFQNPIYRSTLESFADLLSRMDDWILSSKSDFRKNKLKQSGARSAQEKNRPFTSSNKARALKNRFPFV